MKIEYRRTFIVVALLIGTTFTSNALAVVPPLIPVQGVLTDADGQVLDGSYDLSFTIYDSSVASSSLWTETQTGVPVDQGFFSVYLGDETDLLLDVLVSADELWLSMTIGGEELSRVQLAAVPYALEAQVCQQLGDLEADEVQPILSGTNSCPDGHYLQGWNADAGVPLCAPDEVGDGGPVPYVHNHDDLYYTETEVDSALAGKSDTGHLHNDTYYTETEADAFLAGKSDTGHNHDGDYAPGVHEHDAAYVNVTGDTMSGLLDMNDNLITNIGAAGTDFTAGGGLYLAGDLAIGTTTPQADTAVDISTGERMLLRGTTGSSIAADYLIEEAGRAQLVVASQYPDLVVASSAYNNNHGATLTLAAVDPTNPAAYRKWVVNQGAWGSRTQYLEFGYGNAAGLEDPHSAINDTYTTMTLDGVNRRVGINDRSPSAALDVNGTILANGDIRNTAAQGQLGVSADKVFRDLDDSWLYLRNGSGSSTYADLAVGNLHVNTAITNNVTANGRWTMSSCPSEYTYRRANLCTTTAEREATTFAHAQRDCMDEGAHVCTYEEYYYWFWPGDVSATDSGNWLGGSLIADDAALCINGTSITNFEDECHKNDTRYYRCCLGWGR